MGLVDLFRPKHRHSDVRVRSEAIRAMSADDAAILEQVARTDRDIGVRRIAIEKIHSAEVLSALHDSETERSLRELIGTRAGELWTTRACGADGDASAAALAGLVKLGDQRALVDVVVRAQNPATRKRAFGELRDPRALADLAKSDAAQDLRIAAVARIDDGDVLRALAVDTTAKEVGLAAVEKLDDVDRLEHVAQKAKNKAVRQKARKIVSEIAAAEAERTKAPGLSDDVKRRRAEKAQLVRTVEGLADSFEFDKAAPQIAAASEAWGKLAGEDPGDDRFSKAVERFGKRHALHLSQARSADELRVVAREADEDKRRASAERAAADKAQAAAAAEVAAPSEPDPEADAKRAARDAIEQARRDEHTRLKVEDDARRAAQAAERDAKRAEIAAQGAAIATSLEAMTADMEQLAAGDGKDIKGIDRALQQASKAFEGIGKVPTDRRDALAERYRAARAKLVMFASDARQAEDWVRFANVAKAEALIATAREFAEAADVPDLGNRLRGLQALWKEVGPLPQKRSKELWDTFKQACDLVYDKVRAGRAVEDEQFAAVAKVKEALIAEAAALADSTEFAATAEKLKALQAQWKLSGHLPRKQGDVLWAKFRAACDTFFERRKPLLEARANEELDNLRQKQALIARAAEITAKAPGEGGWGKAIGEIKDLQARWKEIGYVPRRDADALWTAFRAACDGLFAKRDDARDGEANAHRAEIEAVRAEIEAVRAGGEDVVTRAIAVRTKAGELGVLGAEVSAMVQHVVAAHADAVKGTELDPAQLRARREKLIARAEELLPKQAAASDKPVDLATQLKTAMQKNAFGDLRFSGRDPIEVADELRASWTEAGPILDDEDRAQVTRFEDTLARVLEAAGARPTAETRAETRDTSSGEAGERTGRRRRERVAAPVSTEPAAIAEIVAADAAQPSSSPIPTIPDARASAVAAIGTPVDPAPVSDHVPVSVHDAVTQPARLPPEMPIGLPEQAPVAAPAPRAHSMSIAPPMDDLDTGWDMGDADPPAGAAAEPAIETPSSAEMAGDGAPDGDDQVD